jgi:hypothetical protein
MVPWNADDKLVAFIEAVADDEERTRNAQITYFVKKGMAECGYTWPPVLSVPETEESET